MGIVRRKTAGAIKQYAPIVFPNNPVARIIWIGAVIPLLKIVRVSVKNWVSLAIKFTIFPELEVFVAATVRTFR